jgi:hypothetical protein
MLKNGDMIPRLHIEILHLSPNYFDENPLSTENNKDKSLKVVKFENKNNNNSRNKKSFISNVSSINTNDLMLTDNLESTKRICLSTLKSKRKVHWIDRKHHNHKIPLMEIIDIESFKKYNYENSYKGNLEEVMNDKKKCCYSKCNII